MQLNQGQLQIWTEHSHTDLLKLFKLFLISLLVSDFQRLVWECSVHICSCPWSNKLRTTYLLEFQVKFCSTGSQ